MPFFVGTNRFFVDAYKNGVDQYRNIEAREHTAQVKPEDREDREERFREARLPLLFCSPTMELGVDIAAARRVVRADRAPRRAGASCGTAPAVRPA